MVKSMRLTHIFLFNIKKSCKDFFITLFLGQYFLKQVNTLFLCSIFILLIPTMLQASDTFLDWNDSGDSGTTWTGWEYCDGSVEACIGYSAWGWKEDGYVTLNAPLPRSFVKWDYDNKSQARLDRTFIPPSVSTGASLHVYDDGSGTVYQPSWWIIETDDNLSGKGITTDSTNRLSLYLYLDGLTAIDNPDTYGYTFEWGTYTCWENGYGDEDCPTESSNGHYYHTSTIAPNMWVHVLYDEHPYHRRSVTDFPVNNPTLAEYGHDYFSSLNKMYMQFTHDVSTANSSGFWVDELKFMSTTELGETNQNDISITTLWVGYDPTDSHWEIGWNDLSINGTNDTENEIRWSTSPITNDNFSSATIVQPLDFVVNTNHVHKSNGYKMMLWTRFNLPDGAKDNDKLYFAVKDVSVEGGNYHAPPSSYIHTIDYSLAFSQVALENPVNLRIE